MFIECSFKHYGKNIIESICQKSFAPDVLDRIHKKIYETFVEEVDGVDNGIDCCKGDANYHVTTSISSRVKRLEISWTEEWSVGCLHLCIYW